MKDRYYLILFTPAYTRGEKALLVIDKFDTLPENLQPVWTTAREIAENELKSEETSLAFLYDRLDDNILHTIRVHGPAK